MSCDTRVHPLKNKRTSYTRLLYRFCLQVVWSMGLDMNITANQAKHKHNRPNLNVGGSAKSLGKPEKCLLDNYMQDAEASEIWFEAHKWFNSTRAPQIKIPP